MGRQPCCDKIGLKRGPWTIEEDHKLLNFIIDNGVQCWRTIPKLAGLLRCGKSCRLRWINYLRPDLKRGMLSELEENQIIQLHARIGNRWSKIASHFPGRTDNEIKNHWNTRIKKRLKLLGIDPVTHKPVERKEKTETETESSIKTMPGSISTTMDTNSKVDDSEGAIHNRKIEDIISSDESANVIINYKPVCENLDVDLWMNQESNTCTSYSSTFSLEESLNNSFMGESTSVQEDSIQDWDSMFSWDVFNQLEEEMFCFRNGH